MCSVIGQDKCIPDILLKNLMPKRCSLKLPLPGEWGEGLQNESIFSAVHENSRTFEMLTRKSSTPGGVGSHFLLIFWAVRDISRTFEMLTPKCPPGTPARPSVRPQPARTHARTRARARARTHTAAFPVSAACCCCC